MKSTLVAATLVTTLITPPAFSNSSSDNANKSNYESSNEIGVGFGTGTLVGGIAAGPIGMVTGALIGSLIGQNTANEKEKNNLSNSNTSLQEKLNKKENVLLSLQEDKSTQSLALHDAHKTIEKLLTQNIELKNHALNFDIQFRTNSIYIEKQYQKYLQEFAKALHSTPSMEVEVAGFSDRIGDEDYNMELSNQRAVKVRDYLIKQGVQKDRITTLAHGESQPLHIEENFENNFFDRRVTVYLRPVEIIENDKDETLEPKVNLSSVTK